MPTANFNKYNAGTEALLEAVNAGTDSWRIILSNTAPDLTDAVQADAAELPTLGGYSVGGNACSVISSSQSNGVYKLVLGSPAVWTGTGTGFSARYAILWNQTVNALIGYWDYGSSQLIAAGETLAVGLDATNGVFTVS
jgi:hypothetical protein